MTNVERLQQAGLIPTPNPLTPADTALVNSLSADEVNTLISVKQKLGSDFCSRNLSAGANCFI